MAKAYKPALEDHHRPMIRCREDTQELMSLLLGEVQKAIAEELERREIKPGSLAALHCDFHEKTPNRFGLVFTIHMRGPDDTAIEFRGTL